MHKIEFSVAVLAPFAEFPERFIQDLGIFFIPPASLPFVIVRNPTIFTANMGNIYLALNQKEDAIQVYKKALQLNPRYEEAKNRLKELEGK